MSNYSINLQPQKTQCLHHQHNHDNTCHYLPKVSILARQVSADLNTSRRTVSDFKNNPPVLKTDSSRPQEVKELTPHEFNVLNSITNSGELKEFVTEHITNYAKEKNINLDAGSTPSLRTNSSFNSDKATTVYFLQHGKNSNGESVFVNLSVGDTKLRQITPEVMGIIAKSFNMDSSIHQKLREELGKSNSELMRANSENRKLQDENKQLSKTAEKLQNNLEDLRQREKNCVARLGQLMDKAKVSEEAQLELKHLREVHVKLNDEITQCKNELDSAKQELHTNQQKLSKLESEHHQQITEIKAEHNAEKTVLQNRAEFAENKLETQKGEINAQAQHLLKLGKRSYWPTALAGVASAVALVFMGIKAAGLNSAEDDLKDADNDDNYVKQGNDARDAAVAKQIEEDSAAYVQALKDDTVDTQEIQDIIARYNVDSSGAPQFGAETLSDVGKPYMEEKGEKGRVEGVQKAKTEAIEKAQHTVDQAKESVGLLGGAAGLSLLLTGGFFTYARSKNKHLVATEKSINQALAENKPFKAPEEKGFVKFTGTINRFVSGNRAPASATLISR